MKEYTLEELMQMHDENERFVGKTANMEKIRKYNEIKKIIFDLVKKIPECFCWYAKEYKPNPHDREASVILDVSTAELITDGEWIAIKSALDLCDGISIAVIDSDKTSSGKAIRICFHVDNCWE